MRACRTVTLLSCAWILWAEVSRSLVDMPKEIPPSRSWSAVAVADDIAACRERLIEASKELKTAGWIGGLGPTGDVSYHKTEHSTDEKLLAIRLMSLACFPASFDPRPRTR